MDNQDQDYDEAVKLACEWYADEGPHIQPILSAIKLGRLLQSAKQGDASPSAH